MPRCSPRAASAAPSAFRTGRHGHGRAHLTGVTAGDHGFHIHETGDCSSADYKSAGGHFNPTGAPHGAPSDAAHHAGDLGNITIAADGTGTLSISTSMLTVSPVRIRWSGKQSSSTRRPTT
jgi:Cu/Zn superoxide dismutase